MTNPEQRFRITVFNCLIDTVTTQLTQRFTAMSNLVTKFSIIFPNVLSSTPEHDIVAQATALQKDYITHLSEAFPVQLVHLHLHSSRKLPNCHLWRISLICLLWITMRWLQLSQTSFLRCYCFSPCQSQSQLLKDHSQRCALLRVTYGTPWGKIDFEHWHYSASKPSRHS